MQELTKKQHELLELAHQFQSLRSFVAELRRVTKYKPFDIHHEVAWNGAINTNRMLVIDLAAWVKSLSGGWLRTNLSGASLAMLRTSKKLAKKLAEKASIDAPPDVERFLRERRVEEIFEHRANALKRLFGKVVAARGAASGTDVRRLEERLAKWAENLDSVRNQHAHRYGRSATVKTLRFHDLSRRIEKCARLLNDIRFLLDQSTYSLPDLDASDGDIMAKDLVDLIVVGTTEFAASEFRKHPGQFRWQRREAYYGAMHARSRPKKSASFNRT